MKGKAEKKIKFAVLGLCALFLIGILPVGVSEGISSTQTVQAATKKPKVKLNKTKATLIKTQTLQLEVKGTDSKVKWKSSKKSVASVDDNGLVTAKKKGTAIITATVDGNKYTCEIKVETPSINKSEIILFKNETMALKINGTTQKVKWSTSDKSIVGVRSTGFIAGKKSGTAIITAKIGDFEYTCNVTVENPSFENEEEYLFVGDEVKLVLNGTNRKVSWKSSDPRIATVDENGNVKAIDTGWTMIKAKVGTRTYNCEINIYSIKDLEIKINNASMYLFGNQTSDFKIGDSAKIELSHQYSPQKLSIDQNLVQWSSSDENIVTISDDGIINILGNGVVRITALYKNNIITQDIRILDKEYLNDNIQLELNLENIRESKFSENDINFKCKIKNSFPIHANGKIILYNSNHEAIAVSNMYVYINHDRFSVDIPDFSGNQETAASYEYSLDYILEVNTPIIDINNDISVSAVWTTKNNYSSKYENEHMITVTNNSVYSIAEYCVRAIYYGLDGSIISEKDYLLSSRNNYRNAHNFSEQEISKVEFKVLYAYALMKD